MTDEIQSYKLEKVTHRRGGLRTAAFIWCSLCEGAIDSHGGPGYGTICLKCGDALQDGRLRGLVTWEKEDETNRPAKS